MSPLEGVVGDLLSESDQLKALVASLPERPDGWRAATPAAEAAAPELLDSRRRARAKLVSTLRALPDGTRIPWYGPPMGATSSATACLVKTWAHASDVSASLGVSLPADDRVRGVVHIGVRTRDYAYRNRGPVPPDDGSRDASLGFGA